MADRTLGWWLTLYAPGVVAIGIFGAVIAAGAASADLSTFTRYGVYVLVASQFLVGLGAITTPIGMKLDQDELERCGYDINLGCSGFAAQSLETDVIGLTRPAMSHRSTGTRTTQQLRRSTTSRRETCGPIQYHGLQALSGCDYCVKTAPSVTNHSRQLRGRPQ